ncbi:hypothetical protein GPECTOR_126g516 [Gonium pectorale]|uniref:Right handed beta helix domain-containing protein n=1 Tax=Gonium pectorale TaxID=33097 RepID=A0A150G016_GONPE|nr:hypothetical protein GPECTOR_126g516 [Gonium pectorale]|eukprot:KXZ42660.1 hypothetical protein GPECTOR_126g516 [Gonium pectorale]
MFSVNGSSNICGNRANVGSGGAIYIHLYVISLTVDGSSNVSGNQAGGSGGAIYVRWNVDMFSVNGSSNICGNRANVGNGGAIYVQSYVDTLTIDGSSNISGNSAGDSGGAIYVSWNVDMFSVNGSSNISGNSANGGSDTGLLPKKGDPLLIKNNALANTLYKLYTSLITLNTVLFSEMAHIFTEAQEGYLRQRNTERQIHKQRPTRN